jgi:hypothetical protein
MGGGVPSRTSHIVQLLPSTVHCTMYKLALPVALGMARRGEGRIPSSTAHFVQLLPFTNTVQDRQTLPALPVSLGMTKRVGGGGGNLVLVSVLSCFAMHAAWYFLVFYLGLGMYGVQTVEN